MTVAIEYSYPTSPNAKHYGYYHEGCYTVSIDDESGSMAIAAFKDFDEAKRFADMTGYNYHRYSLKSERFINGTD